METYVLPPPDDTDFSPARAFEKLVHLASATAPELHPTLFCLGRAALGAHESHGRHGRRIIEPIAAAIRHYLADQNATDALPRSRKGGLSRWQEVKAKEMLSATSRASVEETARACELSRGHFSRAFRISTGLTPREWNRRTRLDAAQAALLVSGDTAAAIARRYGFTSASHLHLAMGAPPSATIERRRVRDAT